MTFEELHEILDNEDKKLSLKELEQVIYELKQDCFNREYLLLDMFRSEEVKFKIRYYQGEQNAFQIVLDLLEHLKENNNG